MAGNASKLKPEIQNRNWAPPLQALHNSIPVQTKLEIGSPGDKYEQEADAMANQVMMAPYDRSKMVMMAPNPDNPTLRMMPMPVKNTVKMAGNPDNPTLRMKPQVQKNEQMGYEEEEQVQMMKNEEEESIVQMMENEEEDPMVQMMEHEEEQVQMQTQEEEERGGIVQAKPVLPVEELPKAGIQKSEDGTKHASSDLTENLNAAKGQGSSLPEGTNQELGSKMSADFSKVKIHTDGQSVQMNQELGAKAFTHGNNIYFNKGEYNPASQSGKHLLAHELTHTIQQSGQAVVQNSGGEKIQKKDTPAEAAEKIHDKHTSFFSWVTDEEGMGKTLAGLVGKNPEVIERVINKLDGEDKAQVSVLIFENLSDSQLMKMHSALARTLFNIMLFKHINELSDSERKRAFIQAKRVEEVAKRARAEAREKAKEKARKIEEAKKLKAKQTDSVSKVKSLEIAKYKAGIKIYEDKNIAGAWSTVKRKMIARDKQLEDAEVFIGKLSADQKGAYNRIKSRWPTLRSYVNGTAEFDPVSQDIASKTVMTNTINADKKDIAILKGNKFFKTTASVISESLTAINNFLNKKKELAKRNNVLDEEKVEFHRFDDLFRHTDLIKLVKAIPHMTVTAGDIKAITAQETGDFTNITVAGIKDKKTKGIKSDVENPSVYKGLGQHDTGSRDEAIAWASKKGVTIAHGATDDARSDPQRAILLTAAYLGRVTEELIYPGLPENKPSGIELKKLILAGYNGGQNKVKKAARAYVGTTAKNYTWDDIKDNANITGQMRNYVSEILERLP